MALVNPKKVLITDKIDSSCKSFLESNAIDVDMKIGLPKEDLLAIIKVIFLRKFAFGAHVFLARPFSHSCGHVVS